MTNDELWKAVLGEMELSLSKAHFTTWFKSTSILSKDTNSVLVSAPNAFVKEWLENKFNRKILDSIRHLTPEVREIKYVIGVPKIDLRQGVSKVILDRDFEEKTILESDKDIDRSTNLNKKYSFESYIVGSNNELAHAASLAITKNIGNLYNPLFIYGGVGLGKTHLLQAIGNRVMLEHKDSRVLYVPAEKLTADLIASIQNRTIEDLKNHYNKLDLMIIDDVQFIAGKDKVQEELFHTLSFPAIN